MHKLKERKARLNVQEAKANPEDPVELHHRMNLLDCSNREHLWQEDLLQVIQITRVHHLAPQEQVANQQEEEDLLQATLRTEVHLQVTHKIEDPHLADHHQVATIYLETNQIHLQNDEYFRNF